jgi:hypothetical protein
MYISNKNSMTVLFIFESACGTAEESALLDSGATENFMDQRMISQLKIGTKQLPTPRKVHNVDGTENWSGTITEYCSLWIRIGACEALQRFFITNLGHNRAIFSYPWLKFFNPRVDWTQGVLEEPPVQVEMSLFKWWKKHQLVLKACAEARSVGEGKRAHIARTNLSQQWAEEANKDKVAWENSELPAKYQRHAIVFSEEVAKRFPPAWPEDHVIKLKDGAPDTINCKVYPLTKPEQEATKKFIEENKALGFIQKTDSPWSTPWFFIKKKDGSLRPIQDYREVNKWTVRDVYPILRICQGSTGPCA